MDPKKTFAQTRLGSEAFDDHPLTALRAKTEVKFNVTTRENNLRSVQYESETYFETRQDRERSRRIDACLIALLLQQRRRRYRFSVVRIIDMIICFLSFFFIDTRRN